MKSNFTNAQIGLAVSAFSPEMDVRINHQGNIQMSHKDINDYRNLYFSISYQPEYGRYRISRRLCSGTFGHPLGYATTFKGAVEKFRKYMDNNPKLLHSYCDYVWNPNTNKHREILIDYRKGHEHDHYYA